MKIEVDRQRLISEIEALASISDAEPPAVTRVVFTPADLKARAWLQACCEEAGLALRQDPIGNTFVRWTGSDPTLPPVGTGSHIDAIPNAGKYDGVVGVLGGLEAIRALQQSGFRPRHSIELLVFTAEEPTRFGIGCLGSRMLSGTLSADAARQLKDSEGASLDEVREAAGIRGDLEAVKLPSGYYSAFVELHIEQGPRLEGQGIPLGVVTSIAAPTVGICEVFPGAVNSIPSRVRLSADIRDTDLERRDDVMQQIETASQAISAKRRVPIRTEVLNADAPANCAPAVIEALSESCEKHSLRFVPIVSRAYHDSLFMSRIAPTAMLFIPCRNGYSHRPDEYASPEDIARGTLVLAETLAALSQ